MRVVPATLAALFLAAAARGGEAVPAGLYAVTVRLELPHVERWAVDQTHVVCIGDPDAALPVPVLGAAASFAPCAARDVVREEAGFSYVIDCPGRDAPRASAVYRLTDDGFRGRIAMIMGAKNMTMTEVQSGRRLGPCTAPASAGATGRQPGAD
jgi:hypothetical protein